MREWLCIKESTRESQPDSLAAEDSITRKSVSRSRRSLATEEHGQKTFTLHWSEIFYINNQAGFLLLHHHHSLLSLSHRDLRLHRSATLHNTLVCSVTSWAPLTKSIFWIPTIFNKECGTVVPTQFYTFHLEPKSQTVRQSCSGWLWCSFVQSKLDRSIFYVPLLYGTFVEVKLRILTRISSRNHCSLNLDPRGAASKLARNILNTRNRRRWWTIYCCWCLDDGTPSPHYGNVSTNQKSHLNPSTKLWIEHIHIHWHFGLNL